MFGKVLKLYFFRVLNKFFYMSLDQVLDPRKQKWAVIRFFLLGSAALLFGASLEIVQNVSKAK